MTFDDDVLKQVAETRFHGALVSAVDFEEVCNRALLTDMSIGLHEHHASRIAEVGAARRELFERCEAALDGGKFLLAGAQVSCAFLVLAPRHRELRAPIRQLLHDSLERGLRLGAAVPCWRLGEEEIGYWHEIEAGFGGRQPLD